MYITDVLRRSSFIVPSSPVLRARPPAGDAWLHEVKFDGYRVQLHKAEKAASIFSRTGADFTPRYPPVASAILALPTRAVILDGELVACNAEGLPDFHALHSQRTKSTTLCVWCFDLLSENNRDLQEEPFTERRRRLTSLLKRAAHPCLQLSETFDDPHMLLASCERMGLEGIVSKRRDAPYRSGKGNWIKVKCASWREANKNRGDLFNKVKHR